MWVSKMPRGTFYVLYVLSVFFLCIKNFPLYFRVLQFPENRNRNLCTFFQKERPPEGGFGYGNRFAFPALAGNRCFPRSSPRERHAPGVSHLDWFDSCTSSKEKNNKSTPGGVLLFLGAEYGNRTRQKVLWL